MAVQHTHRKGAGKKMPPKSSKQKATPVISLSGSPPPAKQTWWSQRFIEVLESFKMGNRLARGKAYAEEAKVLKLSISSGVVNAAVQGSRKQHYKVSIKVEPLSDISWRQVLQNMTRKAIYPVEMLNDKMPKDIEEVFQAARVSLFPHRLEDLRSECDCPDWSNPCKHIAATYYVLAKHFDLDPFLIFVWRGRLKTQILESLRNTWRAGRRKGENGHLPKIKMASSDLDTFWKGDAKVEALTPLDPFSKSVPDSAIRQLGEAPVQLDGTDLGEVLGDAYLITSMSTRAWILSKSFNQAAG